MDYLLVDPLGNVKYLVQEINVWKGRRKTGNSRQPADGCVAVEGRLGNNDCLHKTRSSAVRWSLLLVQYSRVID